MLSLTIITKPDFRDRLLVNHLGVANLKALAPFAGVVSGQREGELPHIRIGPAILPKLIAEAQSIVVADLGVNPGAKVRAGLRGGDRLRQRSLIEVLVQDNGAHDGVVLDIAALSVDKERGLLVERPTKVSVKHLRVIARNLCREGIPRVESRVIPVDKELAMKFVSARLRQDFDPAITQHIVLRGKRILVDANFADGGFGGQLAA